MTVGTDRTKLTGTDYEGTSFRISRNNETLGAASGAYITKGYVEGLVIPVDQLDAVIEALKTIKDEYEALKPKVPSLREVIEAAPIGTTWERISFSDGVRVKIFGGYIIAASPQPDVLPFTWLNVPAEDYVITYPKGHNA